MTINTFLKISDVDPDPAWIVIQEGRKLENS